MELCPWDVDSIMDERLILAKKIIFFGTINLLAQKSFKSNVDQLSGSKKSNKLWPILLCCCVDERQVTLYLPQPCHTIVVSIIVANLPSTCTRRLEKLQATSR